MLVNLSITLARHFATIFTEAQIFIYKDLSNELRVALSSLEEQATKEEIEQAIHTIKDDVFMRFRNEVNANHKEKDLQTFKEIIIKNINLIIQRELQQKR